MRRSRWTCAASSSTPSTSTGSTSSIPRGIREKLAGLLRKVAKYSETFLNQGKRTAEQAHCRFLPGEENEQRAVVTPPGLKEAFQEYYRSGFGRFHVPRGFGGLELPHGFLDLVSEIVNAGSVAMGTGFELTQGASLILQHFGSDWMKDVLIPGLYDGRFQGTMCLTEPQAGSDLGAVATTAERIEGTDTFRINGTKVFITAGDHDMAENVIHIVLAKIRGVAKTGHARHLALHGPEVLDRRRGTLRRVQPGPDPVHRAQARHDDQPHLRAEVRQFARTPHRP